MAILTVKDICEATAGVLLSENSGILKGVSIDSRSISEGELFFAIRGERFDGHDFLEDALARGSGAIVDKKPGLLPKGKIIIQVNDTLRSLQDLAHFLRMKRDIPVVAVTGSNGKTTTKEMIYAILSQRFQTLKNEGNLNNHIGLPLSLTRLNPDDEMIVLEMGMNAAGEIRRLCEIAAPSHGVITNVGSAHVGKLGSYEAVRAAKLEILEGLSVAVINADDDYLIEGVSQCKDFKKQMITFAINSNSHVTAKQLTATEKGTYFVLDIRDGGNVPVRLNVFGLFNVYNALAAAAVCFSLGMHISEIRAALEAYRGVPMRFEVIRVRGITIINDSYNANPSSIQESLKELIRLGTGGRTVAVLGDMRELSEFSDDHHKDVGRMISELGVDIFVAVGEKMGLAAKEIIGATNKKATPEIFTFQDADEAKEMMPRILQQGDTALLKGSRLMKMEMILEGITNVL